MSDNRADLAKLRVPSLILRCSQDIVAPQSVRECMHRSLPESRLVVLCATGHCPNLSAPAETIEAMRSFL